MPDKRLPEEASFLPPTRSRLNYERELERTRQFLDDDWRGTSLDAPQINLSEGRYA
jgi:hypothetical protein